MGETENLHFYDLGSFEGVPEAQNQLFLSLETQDTLTNQERLWAISKYYFRESHFLKSHNMTILEKTDADKSRRSFLIAS